MSFVFQGMKAVKRNRMNLKIFDFNSVDLRLIKIIDALSSLATKYTKFWF